MEANQHCLPTRPVRTNRLRELRKWPRARLRRYWTRDLDSSKQAATKTCFSIPLQFKGSASTNCEKVRRCHTPRGWVRKALAPRTSGPSKSAFKNRKRLTAFLCCRRLRFFTVLRYACENCRLDFGLDRDHPQDDQSIDQKSVFHSTGEATGDGYRHGSGCVQRWTPIRLMSGRRNTRSFAKSKSCIVSIGRNPDFFAPWVSQKR
jgi:hypothetical protein